MAESPKIRLNFRKNLGSFTLQVDCTLGGEGFSVFRRVWKREKHAAQLRERYADPR